MSFICPICKSPHFDTVIVARPDGSPYRTDLYYCLSCTLVFLEPALFTDAPKFRETVRPATRAHEVADQRQELSYRYWRARARRLNGGIAPKHEEILALRSRLER